MIASAAAAWIRDEAKYWLYLTVGQLWYCRQRKLRLDSEFWARYEDDQSRTVVRGAAANPPWVVCMRDRYSVGGFTDFLASVLSFHAYCTDRHWAFKIFSHGDPTFGKILLPKTDWVLKEGELSFSVPDAKVVWLKIIGDIGHRNDAYQYGYMRRELTGRHAQYHVYSNFAWDASRFGASFDELFEMSPALKADVERFSAVLDADRRGWISVSARFAELLGDFKEPEAWRIQMSPEEQEGLIRSALEQVGRIAMLHPGQKVLVASDSRRFLDRAVQAFPDALALPGDIGHVELDKGEAVCHKTVLDFLMIARAAKSYLLLGSGMYDSGFPKRAAQIGGHACVVWRFRPDRIRPAIPQ